MPLFDQFLIVDWSANNTPKQGADSIWLCLVGKTGAVQRLENPSTRFEAIAIIDTIFEAALEVGEKLFAGFDFAFGYPKGAAECIGGSADWSSVWSRVSRSVEDADNNCSNRFEVAATFNRKEFASIDGPFWGHPPQHGGRYDGLGPKRPSYTDISEHRRVETVVPKTQPVWKLAYTGSVGSQSLLGIARLEQLRDRFANKIGVWPFETKFDDQLDAPITVAEIYPSLLQVVPKPDEVKDSAQVRTMAQTFWALDQKSSFGGLLSAPADLTEDEKEICVREEGWIVGAGHELDTNALQSDQNRYDYIRDPAEIYQQSFATVENEAALEKLPSNMRSIAIRLIHSCGMVDVIDDLDFSPNAVEVGKAALRNDASVFCDVEMVRSGVIERLLPAANPLLCTLNNEKVPNHAKLIGNTRSAAAVDFWGEDLEGAIVVIGNAPTALFRLLERIAEGAPKPALVIGIPVGFVGAVESKQALAENPFDLEFITVHGRRGGSAMASSVVNALAGGLG